MCDPEMLHADGTRLFVDMDVCDDGDYCLGVLVVDECKATSGHPYVVQDIQYGEFAWVAQVAPTECERIRACHPR